MNTNIKLFRQNGLNDIFSYLDKNGNKDFVYFPSSMEMSEEDVYCYIN